MRPQLAPVPHPSAQRVSRLTLDAFRNYRAAAFAFEACPIAFIGENGAGKTNLLEALSLLSPGRGLRRAALPELQNNALGDHPWALFFEADGLQGGVAIGMGRDPESGEDEKRILRVDGKTARSQNQLAEHMLVLWLTPEMDRLLEASPSPRRRFMDRLVFALDAGHLTRFNQYETALRERARLLREGRGDETWLSSLEDSMAKNGLAIAAARRHWAEAIASFLEKIEAPFPRARLAITGACEALLESQSALDAEETFRAMLKNARGADAQSGMTEHGAHRSDLLLHHCGKDAPAALCSTGEQKALLISLILAQAQLLTAKHGMAPLVLLDDITAHLDEQRRAALCHNLLALGGQAFLTGTDASLFSGFAGRAQIVAIK